jgi:hypothetical protein
MKNLLIFLISAITLITSFTGASAQSTVPRWGSGSGGYNPAWGNTGRDLNYKYFAYRDTTAADTFKIRPNAYLTVINFTLKDSLKIQIPSTTNCYLGDELKIICTGPSGTPFLNFTGTNFQTAGKATLSTGLRAVIGLVFDGAKWVEMYRVVQ